MAAPMEAVDVVDDQTKTPEDVKAAAIGQHRSVVDRYYTRKYRTDIKKPGDDHCILIHTNRISVIVLAPSHPVLKEQKSVKTVNFQVDRNTNRMNNKITGKGKRGAQQVHPNSQLCHITCSDDSQYTIHACLKGSLLEVNENLLEKPHLLTQKTETDGYVAIVLTNLHDHQAEIDKLLSREEYNEIIKKREET